MVRALPCPDPLTALVLGHLADAAGRATQAERAENGCPSSGLALHRAEQRVRLRKLPLGPAGVAWLARARAEELRLRWLADAEAPSEHDLIAGWQATVEEFTAMGSPFETARSQVRLVEVLRAVGRPADARAPAEAARSAARDLGAAPLLARLGRGSPTRDSAGPRR